MNGIELNTYTPQEVSVKTRAQGHEKADAKTAAKQIETEFLNELLRTMMEHTSFGQDTTVSTFLPVITSEVAKSLAVRGIGLSDFFLKNDSLLKAVDREKGDSAHKNKVIVRQRAAG
ncbi:MAG TPA: hypothetical protein VJW95_03840 [Dissulfurispiraceae bacterium]|nr:hypothetical protein [Dissulfurispiraceae bacterium]